jgi:3-oxoadipyl-CoA thiolase
LQWLHKAKVSSSKRKRVLPIDSQSRVALQIYASSSIFCNICIASNRQEAYHRPNGQLMASKEILHMDAFICDAVRTPIGRYGGALSSVRTDDLAAIPIAALKARNPDVDWSAVDDVIYGSANQAGEDNRNVARMAALLAGLPIDVPGTTINRLCASGMDAIGMAARGIRAGDYDMVIAGGVESMSRAPFVMPKADAAFSRANTIYDTTIGWRFVNPKMKEAYGIDSMPQTADNVAADYNINREDQDAFAARSQARWGAAHAAGIFTDEIVPVSVPQRRADPAIVDTDEHPRVGTTADKLGKLRGINGADLTVTAGNASGVNDGSAALLLANEATTVKNGLTPMVRVVGMAAAGVAPRVMGIGPVPATRKVLAKAGLTIDQMDVIELNEAFASQGLATLRELGIPDDAAHVNPNGGAIALGHPLGMSGARLALTAAYQLKRTGGRYALCTMCVGVGQGVAMILERV